MILTSQMPVAHWHEQIGDPTIADSILDRLVHNAYRIELNGESIRKKRGRKPEAELVIGVSTGLRWGNDLTTVALAPHPLPAGILKTS